MTAISSTPLLVASPPGAIRRVIGFSSVAAMGGFLFGFDTAVINGGVVAIRNQFAISALMSGLSVSLALLGSAAGAFAAGPLADRLGRSRVMLLAATLFFVSAIGSGLPFTIYDFTFWRVVGGIGVGLASVIAPAYIAEVAPAYLRGRLGSMQQLAIVTGIFAAALSNFAIARAAGGSAEAITWLGLHAWQWMFLVGAVPAIIYGIGACMIPESPRYLVARDRDTEAMHVLSRILGGDVQGKVTEIRRSLQQDHAPCFSDIIGRFGFLPIVWVGIGLAMLQQLVGINVVFYYSNLLWQTVGYDEHHALITTTIMSVTNIVTTFVGIALIDRIGRKVLLFAGSIGMVATLTTLAFVFGTAATNAAGQPVLSGRAGWVALIAFNLYIFCFGFSWGPVVWVLLGEMFSNRIRASALSVGAAANWLANFAVSTTFPVLIASLGLGAAYGLYAAFAVVSLVFVLTLVRETKGTELESVGEGAILPRGH